MQPLLIGQMPGPRTDRREPLSGRCGERLAKLCGIEFYEFLERFERVNLIRAVPGEGRKGDRFQVDVARRKAVQMLMVGGLLGRRTVLLGANVARVFLLHDRPLLTWVELAQTNFSRETLIAVCPHPSGVNRWYNDPNNLRRCRRFWRELVE